MKYYSVEQRAMWEIQHRVRNPTGKQNYRMASSILFDQSKFETKIAEYQTQGRRLTKKMRNYLRSKENA